MSTSEHRFTGRCRCGQGLSLVSASEQQGIKVTCPSCRKAAYIRRIEGELNPNHKCDPRCTGAKGFVCSCACGGANHGSDHSHGVVVAVRHAASPQPAQTRPVRRHLGEVGKNIVGEVTVRTRKPVKGDKFLFTLITNDGDRITWFVPDQYAPDWDEGWHGKIRAKVIRHEDHETYGKSTVVIYVKEVDDE